MACTRLHADDLISAREAAELAGVAYQTWRYYCSREIAPTPAVRVGTAPYWTREQVREWLRQRATE